MTIGNPNTWGDVVEGDEVYSDKTGRWYEVAASVRLGADSRITLENGKQITKPASDPVKIRRGPTGQAADLLVTVLYSGEVR